MLPLLACVALCAASGLPAMQDKTRPAKAELEIDVVSGAGLAPDAEAVRAREAAHGRTTRVADRHTAKVRRLDPQRLGLGSGGLLPRARWAARARRLADGSLRSRGGAEIAVRGQSVHLRLTNGLRLEVDQRARLVGDGRPLTDPALAGLALRLHDGGELQVWPQQGRAAQRIVFVDDAEHYYLSGAPQEARRRRGMRRRVTLERQRRQRRLTHQPFQGLIFYVCGNGDEVVSLVSFGPVLYVRPILVRGRAPRSRAIVLGDTVREAVVALEESTPRHSVQHPLAAKQARMLRDVVEADFAADKARKRPGIARRSIGAGFALDNGRRWSLYRRGRWGLVLAQHLAPDAEPSLEFYAYGGKSRLDRILATRFQQRGRTLGRGVDVLPILGASLPWALPLAHRSQQRKAWERFSRHLSEAPHVQSKR